MCKSEVIIIDTVSNSLMVLEGMSRSLEQVPPALQFLRLVMDDINNSANIDMEISDRTIIDIEPIEEASAELQELTRAQDIAANSSNGLSSKIKGLISDFLKFENIKKGLDATIGGAARLEKEIINMGNALGNKDVGKALFLNLNKYANESAYSIEELNGITREFINSTKDPNKLMNLNKTAEKLTLLDPGQGLTGAGGALKEALGGDYASLQSNFQFNDGDIQMLQSAKGMDDFINKFNILLDKKGATEQALQELNMSASSQFSNISSNIQTAFAQAGGNALAALKPILTTINEGFRDGRFQPFFDGIANGITSIANIGVWLFNIMQSIGNSIQDNWGTIAPILAGAIGAMITLKGATLAYSVVQGISTGIQTAHAIAIAVKTGTTIADAAATNNLTVAQWALNNSILACPIIWIIIGIIMLIAVFYAAIGAVNKFAGTSLSATGIIAGAFMASLAFVGNLFVGFYNLIIDIIALLYNFFATFSEFLTNVFIDPVGAIVRLFSDMADIVLEVLQGIASAIDTIFGSNLADAVSGWRGGLKDTVDDLVGEAKIKFDRIDSSALHMDRFEYGKSFNSGYNFGKNLADKFSFKMPNASEDITSLLNNDLDDVLDKLGGTPEMGTKDGLALANDNLGQIKDSIDVSNEHLELMRDLAEQESIQNFVTLTPTVQVTTGDIKEEADINKIISKIENYMQTELVNSAEGVYA